MPDFKLPNSKLKMTVGTVYLSPIEKRTEIVHGIYPNQEIKQTLKSKIKREDSELIWVLKDIKNDNSAYKKIIPNGIIYQH